MQKVEFTIASFTVQDPKTGENVPSPSGNEVWTADELTHDTVIVGDRRKELPRRLFFFADRYELVGNHGPAPENKVTDNTEKEGEAPEASPEPKASKKAKAIASELGVDLSQVTGTGANGSITVQDVKDAAPSTEEVAA